MSRTPQWVQRPVAGRRGRCIGTRGDWIGDRNTAAQLLSTSRRRRFADLDRKPDSVIDVLAESPAPAGVRPDRQSTFVEMGSGVAFAVGVVLTSVSVVALATLCGWALLIAP